MTNALQRWIVVSSIILGMGAHWAILQSVAWTGMLVSYSRQGSFKEALQNTFDGRHACELCKFVKAGRQSEQKQGQEKLLLKLDLFVLGTPGQSLFPPSIEPLCLTDRAGYCWSKDSPPTPPPLPA